LKALYRTARAIMEKENGTSLTMDAQTQKMTELVGGEEIYNKIQSLMANPYAYQA